MTSICFQETSLGFAGRNCSQPFLGSPKHGDAEGLRLEAPEKCCQENLGNKENPAKPGSILGFTAGSVGMTDWAGRQRNSLGFVKTKIGKSLYNCWIMILLNQDCRWSIIQPLSTAINQYKRMNHVRGIVAAWQDESSYNLRPENTNLLTVLARLRWIDRISPKGIT